jgi:hypothetical protein
MELEVCVAPRSIKERRIRRVATAFIILSLAKSLFPEFKLYWSDEWRGELSRAALLDRASANVQKLKAAQDFLLLLLFDLIRGPPSLFVRDDNKRSHK